jgi:hypothetical protein
MLQSPFQEWQLLFSQFQDHCYLTFRNKLVFTAADFSIFLEGIYIFISVIHWKSLV